MADRADRVYVGGIDWKITSQELAAHMSAAGQVVHAEVFGERDGRSKGAGIVQYTSPEAANAAISMMNETQLGERSIFVREDRPKGEGKGKGKFDDGFGKGGFGKGGFGKGGFDKGGFDSFGKGKGYGKDSFGKGGYGKGKRDFDDFGKGKSKGPSKGPEYQGRIVHVGNLPFRATWQDLKEVFQSYGQVERVDIAQDFDGRSKGTATVVFEAEQAASAAIDSLNETDFQGRSMRVRLFNI